MLFDRTKIHKTKNLAIKFIYNCAILQEQSQIGNTLGIGIAIGLIALGGTTVALINAGKNKTNVASHEQTQQSLAITEAGINNLLSQLTQPHIRPFLTKNLDLDGKLSNSPENTWTLGNGSTGVPPALETVPQSNLCPNSSGGEKNPREVLDNTEWLSVNNSTGAVIREQIDIGIGDSAGQFQFLAYRYQKIGDISNGGEEGIGTLLVEGKLNKNVNSNSRIQVSFPVKKEINNSIALKGGAGLMAEIIKLGNIDLTSGNIVCTDPKSCVITCSSGKTKPTIPQLKNAIGSTDPSNVTNDIEVGGSVIPPVPNIPAEVITMNKLYEVSNANQLTKISGKDTLILPGSASIHTDGRYYIYTKIPLGQIYVRGDAKVSIYTSSTLNLSDQESITTVNTDNYDKRLPDVGQIRIYGASIDTATGVAILPSTPNYWELSGNSCIHAFIHAPNTYIGYNGSGNGNACSDSPMGATNRNFYGVVWVKGFGLKPDQTTRHNANSLSFVVQPDLLALLKTEYDSSAFGRTFLDTKIGSPTNFQRVSIN